MKTPFSCVKKQFQGTAVFTSTEGNMIAPKWIFSGVLSHRFWYRRQKIPNLNCGIFLPVSCFPFHNTPRNEPKCSNRNPVRTCASLIGRRWNAFPSLPSNWPELACRQNSQKCTTTGGKSSRQRTATAAGLGQSRSGRPWITLSSPTNRLKAYRDRLWSSRHLPPKNCTKGGENKPQCDSSEVKMKQVRKPANSF